MVEFTSIQVDDLHKAYGKIPALDGVNLSVEGAQIFGILGPNGAGKTTLIRQLIGASKPTSGRLSVLGLDPIRQKRQLRRRIGYMPQFPALYEDLSPRDNLRFFGRAHEVANLSQRIAEVIDFVGLAERASDPIFKFSGGMKQRVSLACALVHQPQLLFLDEPTSGIDPKLRETFWQHFRELTQAGVTVFVSTHQMDEAMHCDRLAILHKGSVLVNDSPRQILWDSQARLKIWQREHLIEYELSDYPHQLPRILQSYGLEADVSRISIEEESLETVVLRLINQRERQQAQES